MDMETRPLMVEPSRDEKHGEQYEEQRRRAAQHRYTNSRSVERQRTANQQWRRADGETRHEQRRLNKPAETNGGGRGRVDEAARQKAVETS